MAKNVVVIGTQWGVEGKGKVVDLISPSFDVVARYQGLGIPLLRTDRDGSVTLTTDGVKLWVATYRDGREVRYR